MSVHILHLLDSILIRKARFLMTIGIFSRKADYQAEPQGEHEMMIRHSVQPCLRQSASLRHCPKLCALHEAAIEDWNQFERTLKKMWCGLRAMVQLITDSPVHDKSHSLLALMH
jgi:hypothetical protein